MPLNVALATEILARITADPSAHNQSFWVEAGQVDPDPEVCRTAHCVAGWAVAYSGNPIRTTSEDVGYSGIEIGFPKLTSKGKLKITWKEMKSESEVAVRARDALGLTDAQAEFLFFHTDNGMAKAFLSRLITDELRRQVKERPWRQEDDPTPEQIESRYANDLSFDDEFEMTKP